MKPKKPDLEISDLPLQTREALTLEVIRNTLSKYGRFNGVTAADCSKLSGISEPTTRKNLEKLCLIREAYSSKIGQTIVYFPNGEPLHALGKFRMEDSLPHIIEVVLSRGPKEKVFIHLTEKRYSILEGEKTEGGVAIPLIYVDKLIDALTELKRKE